MNQDQEWPRVPPKGTYVIADHPVTLMNPSRIFRVEEIEWGCTCGVIVRGKNTCWFAVTMLRLPTPEEAANLDNYHPNEL